MYEVANILDGEYIKELLWLQSNGFLNKSPANVMQGTKKEIQHNKAERSTSRIQMHYKLYPEICQSIEDWVGDGTKVNQFDFLLYEVGDHFIKHCDDYENFPIRYWSTVTLLDRSDDLEGGELNVYNGENKETVNLKIGETVIFKSKLFHEVLPVKKGWRKVLVIWLGNT